MSSHTSVIRDGSPLDNVDGEIDVHRGEYIHIGTDESIRAGMEAIVRVNPSSYLQRSLYVGQFSDDSPYNRGHRSRNSVDPVESSSSYGDRDRQAAVHHPVDFDVHSESHYTDSLAKRIIQTYKPVSVRQDDAEANIGFDLDSEVPADFNESSLTTLPVQGGYDTANANEPEGLADAIDMSESSASHGKQTYQHVGKTNPTTSITSALLISLSLYVQIFRCTKVPFK